MRNPLPSQSFESMAKQMSDAVIVTDSQGRVTWCNKAQETLCGHSLEELLGKTPGSVLQGEETDEETIWKLRRAVRQGNSIRTDVLNYHKDGHSYWARLSISPVFSSLYALQGFIAVVQDASDDHAEVDGLQQQVTEMYSAIVRQEQPDDGEPPKADPFL